MSHVRQQIRDRFAALIDGLATTGSNVFQTRIYPLRDDNLPGLSLYTEAEEIDDEEGKVERLQHRSMNIVVTGHEMLAAGLDDQLDTIAAEVEAAVFDDRFLNNLAFANDLISIDTDYSAEAEKPIGTIQLIFKVQYLTEEGSPETAI